jgi:hypothetical protein
MGISHFGGFIAGCGISSHRLRQRISARRVRIDSSRVGRGAATRLLASLVFIATGCNPGFIYTNIKTPYCTNLRSTPLGPLQASAATRRVSIPTGRIDVTAEWDARGIGDIAQRFGIKEVFGCDQKRISVLGGLYSSRTVIVYGR